jgi:2-polyprenyl-3-methyl-5-hydroxy-6-metoxy-1,4-benzoquinol methylase
MHTNPKFSFRDYKLTFMRAMIKVLNDMPPGTLDDAAFPAYVHANPLINWLFWQRLYFVMKNISKNAPYKRALDFGCGSGVLLPILAKYSENILGVDINLQPCQLIRQQITFPNNVEIQDLNENPLQGMPTASFNLITALDVLEHVKDLSAVLEQLLRLLNTNGILIISGPTENFLYQIGRKLAGKEFSGSYHERGTAEIAALARERGKVKKIATLYPTIPLFYIFSVAKN